MAKFMFLYRGCSADAPKMSPEEMQKSMQDWGQWMEGGMKAGWLLDPGDGLKSEGKIIDFDGVASSATASSATASSATASSATVSDGPFAESKELVGGYCMIEAADLEAAVEVARSMPHTGGKIEVRQLAGHAMK